MYINYENEAIGYLDITLGNNWDYIPITRTYIENFLKCNYIKNDTIAKIIIATSELLENAFKYSNKEGIRTKIQKRKDEKTIELVVYNYAEKNSAENLVKYVYEIDKVDNPLQFYLRKMKDAVKHKHNGLGLPRIKYEGKADISAKCYEENNENVTVSVIAKFKF
jgi:hypothetical protein